MDIVDCVLRGAFTKFNDCADRRRGSEVLVWNGFLVEVAVRRVLFRVQLFDVRRRVGYTNRPMVLVRRLSLCVEDGAYFARPQWLCQQSGGHGDEY